MLYNSKYLAEGVMGSLLRQYYYMADEGLLLLLWYGLLLGWIVNE